MPKKIEPKKKQTAGLASIAPSMRKNVRLLIIAAIMVVVIAAASLGGWSYYNSQVKPYQEPAITVNGNTFDLGYYIETLKLYYGKVSPGALSQFDSYGDQEIEKFAGFVEQQIIKNETIIAGAKALGIELGRDAIEKELKAADMPVSDESVHVMTAQKLLEQQVPQTQPQYHVQAILLETETAAQKALSRLQDGEPFDQVSKELTRITDTMLQDGDFGWLTPRQADLTTGGSTFGEALAGSGLNTPAGPVYDATVTKGYGYWVVRAIEKWEATEEGYSDQLRLEGILVGDEQAANEVIDRLNAGEDMDELAKEVSLNPMAAQSGAYIGWKFKGQNEGIFDFLFDKPLETLSGPIGDAQAQTTGGYWVFNVLEKEDGRELSSQQQNLLTDDFLNRCTAELKKNPEYKVESLITEEMRITAINEVVLAQGPGSVFIRNGSLPEGEAGIPYSVQLEAYGNQDNNTWTITKGNLPDGLSLDSTTGLITGTPKMAGGYSVTLKVESSLHHWELDTFIRVHIPVKIDFETLPEGYAGTSYTALLKATGDANNYTWSITGGELPEGLELNGEAGMISGTPATAGTYSFEVTVDDGFGTATKTVTLLISEEAPATENGEETPAE